jgi:hypothetical protein
MPAIPAARAGLNGATKGAAATATFETSLGITLRTNLLSLLPKPKFCRGEMLVIPPRFDNCLLICDLDIAIISVKFIVRQAQNPVIYDFI